MKSLCNRFHSHTRTPDPVLLNWRRKQIFQHYTVLKITSNFLFIKMTRKHEKTFAQFYCIIHCIVTRRVARIWKRGGLFWKSEKCANDVDSNFHWPWISFRWFVLNLRRNVSERSEIQRFFPPKIRWSPKKKKKKTGLRHNSGRFFSQFRKFKRLRGGSFRMGGLFSIFHRKSASKAQKTCVFAYFTSQWGGSSPPRPPPPWLRYWL